MRKVHFSISEFVTIRFKSILSFLGKVVKMAYSTMLPVNEIIRQGHYSFLATKS